MTIGEIIDRAVQICTQNDIIADIDDQEVMTAQLAWGLAAEELVKTDDDARDVLTDIVSNPQYMDMMKYWEADGENFQAFVCSLLYECDEPFVGLVKERIPNYNELEARRTELYASS